VKFEIYNQGELAGKFKVCGAYLFGIDGIPFRLPGKITFKNGLLECNKRNAEAAGLAFLWPVRGFGQVLLSTTRLKERTRPYNVNVELARGKLMEITTKCEDWWVFEQDEALGDSLRKAKDLFVESLQHISDSSKASMLADKSLTEAMTFAEKLAFKHAEVLFEARQKSGGFAKHCFGCRVDPDQMTQNRYVEYLSKGFGFITIPLSWAQVEPEKGRYDFSKIDESLRALSKKRLAVCAGPLLRFSKEDIPQWLLKGRTSFERIREAAYEYVSAVVSRYSNRVHAWRVVSGLNAINHFKFSFGQILEMTRAASLAARGANIKSLKMIELLHPWGEYYASNSDTIAPLVYVDMVMQSGISFDAFGLELVFGKNKPGMHVRDMMQVSAMLDRFGGLNRPVHITQVGVPAAAGGESSGGGVWHKRWDESVQAEWIEQVYKIAFSKPFVETVTYSMLSDNDGGDICKAGLLTADLEPKKSFDIIRQLRKTVLNS